MLVIPAWPGPGFRCRFCRSPKCSYDVLPRHEVRGRIVHFPACRVRYDMAARRLCDLDFIEWLDRQDVHTAQYGDDRPAHKFVQVIA